MKDHPASKTKCILVYMDVIKLQFEPDMYQKHMETKCTSGFNRLLVVTEPMRDRLRPLMLRCSKETVPLG